MRHSFRLAICAICPKPDNMRHSYQGLAFTAP
jgi:hypothetical protein